MDLERSGVHGSGKWKDAMSIHPQRLNADKQDFSLPAAPMPAADDIGCESREATRYSRLSKAPVEGIPFFFFSPCQDVWSDEKADIPNGPVPEL